MIRRMYYTSSGSERAVFRAVHATALYFSVRVIRDSAVSLPASDLGHNTSPAFDAAAEFTDETFL